ncbi:MAG: hypothetical protein AVDCRST_MAG73-1766, partial [uncultured Thermomicrobiales bacterium]
VSSDPAPGAAGGRPPSRGALRGDSDVGGGPWDPRPRGRGVPGRLRRSSPRTAAQGRGGGDVAVFRRPGADGRGGGRM